jgi:hypothetical protein
MSRRPQKHAKSGYRQKSIQRSIPQAVLSTTNALLIAPSDPPSPNGTPIIIGTFGGKQASAPCHDPAYNRRPRPMFGRIQTTIGDALVTLSFW